MRNKTKKKEWEERKKELLLNKAYLEARKETLEMDVHLADAALSRYEMELFILDVEMGVKNV